MTDTATAAQAAAVTIRPVDIRTAPDELLAVLNEFGNVLQAEQIPEDPPRPLELTIAYARNIPAFIDLWWWGAFDESTGQLVGKAELSIERTGQNEHLAAAGVSVLPDWRRRGLGRRLLAPLAEVAGNQGRRLLIGTTSDRVTSGEAFARRLGGNLGLAMHSNELPVAEIDRAMVRRWVEEGPARAAGYSLVEIEGRYPDDLLDASSGRTPS